MARKRKDTETPSEKVTKAVDARYSRDPAQMAGRFKQQLASLCEKGDSILARATKTQDKATLKDLGGMLKRVRSAAKL